MSPRTISAWRVPLAVLVVSLALTAAIIGWMARLHATRAEARFANAVESATDRIVSRLEIYESMLRSGAGLFAALGGKAEALTATSFHRFVEQLDVGRRYPGVQGIGFTQHVRASQIPELVSRMQQEGFPDFRVWPQGPRDDYHSILYLEPLDARNRAAIGYDMMTQPTRAAAMAEARDTGQPVLSGRVTLVQEISGPKQAGFLIYHPVYRGGIVPGTLAERREKLEGFIYAPFRADDLFRGIFGSETHPRVLFQVYDGTTISPDALLHDSRGRSLEASATSSRATTVSVNVSGRPWTIAFQAAPAFEESEGVPLMVLFAALAIALCLALFAVTRAQVRAKQHAEAAAAEKERLYREAQAATQEREDFLSIASHELRTPLAALQLYVQGMERTTQHPGALQPDQVRERLERIKAQAARLATLVNLLLDVSRIRAGRMILSRQRIDLARVVREVASRHLLEADRANTPLNVDADEPLEGDWDPERIDQIVTNLLTNAIKYGGGKPIELSVRRSEVGCVIQVRDQGLGVSPEDLDRIFQRFERTTAARNIGGLGLGLWIVREIVEAHGGTITVDSRLGEGAVFTVTLPC
jgi:two-component system, OmpR family, sensor kinase